MARRSRSRLPEEFQWQPMTSCAVRTSSSRPRSRATPTKRRLGVPRKARRAPLVLLRSLAVWLRWRWLELAIAAGLATLAIASPWLAVLPGVFLAWWASHELRIHRPHSAPPPATPDTVDDERSEASA